MVQELSLHTFNAGDWGSIPGQATKSLEATRCIPGGGRKCLGAKSFRICSTATLNICFPGVYSMCDFG